MEEKSQLLVLCQVLTDPNFEAVVVASYLCGFILHLIGHETISIPEFFSGVHCLTGKTVTQKMALDFDEL